MSLRLNTVKNMLNVVADLYEVNYEPEFCDWSYNVVNGVLLTLAVSHWNASLIVRVDENGVIVSSTDVRHSEKGTFTIDHFDGNGPSALYMNVKRFIFALDERGLMF